MLGLLAYAHVRDASTRPLQLFVHTNRPLRPPNDAVRVNATTGWWPDDVGQEAVAKLAQRWKRQTHKPWNLLQAHKYTWLLQRLASLPNGEPWLMTDTDTMFQCDADELRLRFHALGSQ